MKLNTVALISFLAQLALGSPTAIPETKPLEEIPLP
jgi:hypothetical protein